MLCRQTKVRVRIKNVERSFEIKKSCQQKFQSSMKTRQNRNGMTKIKESPRSETPRPSSDNDNSQNSSDDPGHKQFGIVTNSSSSSLTKKRNIRNPVVSFLSERLSIRLDCFYEGGFPLELLGQHKGGIQLNWNSNFWWGGNSCARHYTSLNEILLESNWFGVGISDSSLWT